MAAVTLRAVGERAGVSRQAPYRHFTDKEELLSVVAVGYFGQVRATMEEAGEAASGPFGRLEATSEAYVRFALENPHRCRLMFGPEVKGSPYPGVHEAAGTLHWWFVQIVADCMEAGELAGGDPAELAALVYATAHGAVDLALSEHSETKRKAKHLDDPLALIRLLLVHLRTR